MQIQRHYTKDGQCPYEGIEFKTVSSEIRSPDGKIVASAADFTAPKAWSQMACDILAQKYFRKAGIPAALKPVPETMSLDFSGGKTQTQTRLKS